MYIPKSKFFVRAFQYATPYNTIHKEFHKKNFNTVLYEKKQPREIETQYWSQTPILHINFNLLVIGSTT